MNSPEGKKTAPNARLLAARAVALVVAGNRSLADALPGLLDGLDARTRALVQELAYGSLRWYGQLDAILSQLLSSPLKKKDQDIRCLLLVGLYQLAHTQVAEHAAVNETVQAVRKLRKTWATRLVNGVLRNYQRDATALHAALQDDPCAVHAHPAWLLKSLQADWPEQWAAVVEAANRRPPMALRVNLLQGGRDAYIAQLAEVGIGASLIPTTHAGIVLDEAVAVDRLPGFADGRVSVQDGAAQLAAELLDVAPGMHVLDACAAPGGKTGHLLESAGGELDLCAVDIEQRRLARVRENLDRLRLRATLCCADVADPSSWWDGRAFDRILLDAPCSATGVIRRHPDIKLLRRARDIPELARIQGLLLDTLWPLLAPGGMLLYATCSVLQQENARVLDAFLDREAQAEVVTLEGNWGRPSGQGRQILPGNGADMDGFFYALLRKP